MDAPPARPALPRLEQVDEARAPNPSNSSISLLARPKAGRERVESIAAHFRGHAEGPRYAGGMWRRSFDAER